jgi:hypothetical protein
MICGRSSLLGLRKRPRVGVGMGIKADLEERTRDTSVRKSSTIYPFSCRAKERAESCSSVRGAMHVRVEKTNKKKRFMRTRVCV